MKRISQKLIYFLAFILCTQVASSELAVSGTSTHKSIESLELEKKVDQLLLLIQKRLVIMHEVARTKWNQMLSIEDQVWEQEILSELVQKAKQYGLDGKWVAHFFQAQIDAAKEIQKIDFSLWFKQQEVKFELVFNLQEELRSYIDRINQEMLEILSKIEELRKKIDALIVLDQPIPTKANHHIDHDIWLLAISPLKQLQ